MYKRLMLLGLVLGGAVLVVVPVRAITTTDVRVETNGVVKEFHAEGNEDVNYISEDGSVKVNLNNSITEIEVATGSPETEEEIEGEIEIPEQEGLNLIEDLLHRWEEWNEAFKDQLKKLFG